MKTLEELKAKVFELEQLSDRLRKEHPSITMTWQEIPDVPVNLLYEAQSFFGSSINQSGNKLVIQYTAGVGNGFTLFAKSKAVKRVSVDVKEYEEI
jgi:hypothetical protein